MLPKQSILADPLLELAMTLCPIAIVTGCAKCPAFKICPLKEVIGDQAPKAADPAKAEVKKRGK